MKTAKVNMKAGIYRSCAIALLVNAAVILALSLLAAIFIHNEYLNINTRDTCAVIIRFLGTFLSAILVSTLQKEGRLLAVCVTSAATFVLLICMSAIFFEVNFSTVGWGILTVSAGGFAGYMVCEGRKKRKVRGKRRYRSR